MKLKDFGKYKLAEFSDTGAEMEIILPDGNPSGAFLRVVGYDSKIYQSRIRGWQEALRAKPGKQLPSDDSENRAVEDAVAFVIGWRGVTADDGKTEVEFTPEAARAIIADRNHKWLREQIEAFAVNRANFIKSSGKS